MRHGMVWQGLSTLPVHIAEFVGDHCVVFEYFVCEQLCKEKVCGQNGGKRSNNSGPVRLEGGELRFSI